MNLTPRCADCMLGQGRGCKCRPTMSTATFWRLLAVFVLAFWSAVVWWLA